MSDGMMQYFAKIGLDVTEFLNGINKADRSLLSFYRDVTVSMQMTMMIFDRVISYSQKFGQMANEIQDLSYTTGLSTEKIQRLQYAAMLSGTEFGTVSNGINRLTLAMEEAAGGSKEMTDAFSELGVNSTGKSPDQVFEETTAALMEIEDPTRRNAIANQIYGKSWKDLLPFMETYIKKGKEIEGISVFDEKELQDLKDANAELEILSRNLTVMAGKGVGFIGARAEYVGYEMANFWDRLQDKESQDDWIRKMSWEEFLKAKEGAGGSKTTTPSPPVDPFAASIQNNDAYANSIDAITSAMREYRDATDDVIEAQNRLNDVNKNYTRDLQMLDPTDLQGFINLRMRHEWDVEDQTANVDAARAGVAVAAAGVGQAGLAAAGITITGPITVNGDKSFEAMIREQRIRNGVRLD